MISKKIKDILDLFNSGDFNEEVLRNDINKIINVIESEPEKNIEDFNGLKDLKINYIEKFYNDRCMDVFDFYYLSDDLNEIEKIKDEYISNDPDKNDIPQKLKVLFDIQEIYLKGNSDCYLEFIKSNLFEDLDNKKQITNQVNDYQDIGKYTYVLKILKNLSKCDLALFSGIVKNVNGWANLTNEFFNEEEFREIFINLWKSEKYAYIDVLFGKKVFKINNKKEEILNLLKNCGLNNNDIINTLKTDINIEKYELLDKFWPSIDDSDVNLDKEVIKKLNKDIDNEKLLLWYLMFKGYYESKYTYDVLYNFINENDTIEQMNKEYGIINNMCKALSRVVEEKGFIKKYYDIINLLNSKKINVFSENQIIEYPQNFYEKDNAKNEMEKFNKFLDDINKNKGSVLKFYFNSHFKLTVNLSVLMKNIKNIFSDNSRDNEKDFSLKYRIKKIDEINIRTSSTIMRIEGWILGCYAPNANAVLYINPKKLNVSINEVYELKIKSYSSNKIIYYMLSKGQNCLKDDDIYYTGEEYLRIKEIKNREKSNRGITEDDLSFLEKFNDVNYNIDYDDKNKYNYLNIFYELIINDIIQVIKDTLKKIDKNLDERLDIIERFINLNIIKCFKDVKFFNCDTQNLYNIMKYVPYNGEEKHYKQFIKIYMNSFLRKNSYLDKLIFFTIKNKNKNKGDLNINDLFPKLFQNIIFEIDISGNNQIIIDDYKNITIIDNVYLDTSSIEEIKIKKYDDEVIDFNDDIDECINNIKIYGKLKGVEQEQINKKLCLSFGIDIDKQLETIIEIKDFYISYNFFMFVKMYKVYPLVDFFDRWFSANCINIDILNFDEEKCDNEYFKLSFSDLCQKDKDSIGTSFPDASDNDMIKIINYDVNNKKIGIQY